MKASRGPPGASATSSGLQQLLTPRGESSINGCMLRACAGCLLLNSLLILPLPARVVRVEVHDRELVLKGRAFGLAGAYEKLAGKIFFSVDPSNPANRIITDIDNAPTNPTGQVEFSADFYLLKPRNIARGNGALLLGIPNRGRKTSLRHFNLAPGSSDPQNEADFGDAFLLREGYTLAWIGWQFDPPREQGRMRLYPPTARQGELPIRGLVRSDFVVQQREYDHLLSDRQHIAYPVADPEAPQNVLTVREGVEAQRHTIPRSQWEFARLQDGKPTSDRTRVYLQGGFEPGKIYEVVYVSEGPPLVGLGPAVLSHAR